MPTKTKLKWIPAHSREAVHEMTLLMSARDWCYFIPPQDGKEGFIPAVVVERVEGYRMMSGNGEGSRPWFWGKTLEEANNVCDQQNAKRGITSKRQQEIVQSTMGDLKALLLCFRPGIHEDNPPVAADAHEKKKVYIGCEEAQTLPQRQAEMPAESKVFEVPVQDGINKEQSERASIVAQMDAI